MKKFLKKGDGPASGNAAAGDQSLLSVADNREGIVVQRKEQSMIDSSPRVVAQRRNFAEAFGAVASAGASHSGLPEQLKTGIEAMSGMDLANVRVFYNSGKPALLDASAYAQGNEIHVGPGQERWLPHEGWHIVQQRQGRVKPTTYRQGVDINDQEGLEQEADAMGARALHVRTDGSENPVKQPGRLNDQAFQSVYTQLRSKGDGDTHGHFLTEDGPDMKNTVTKSLFLAMLRNQVEAIAEAELSAIGQTVANCPYIAYWFAYYQGLPVHEIERAVRLYAPETREMLDPYEVISIVVKKVQAGLQEQLATGTIDPVDKDRPSELREDGVPLGNKGVFQLGCCNTPEAVNDQVQPDQVVVTDVPVRSRRISLDRRGNDKRDTAFESRLSHLIFQEKELYNVHFTVAQAIARAMNRMRKIKTDETPSAKGTDMKAFVEEVYAAQNFDDDFQALYRTLRKDFPDWEDDDHRGREEHEYDFDSQHTGIMTPRSGSEFLNDDFQIPYAKKPGAYRYFKAPDPRQKTNPANDTREALGLPFGAGPSGSLVYSLAMLRHFKMKKRYPIPEVLQDKNIEMKYAISLAAYLVRHGHHSFFEAMVPVMGLDFKSKESFYTALIQMIGDAGFPALQEGATELFQTVYGN